MTDRGAIRTHDGPGGWHITLVECPDGLSNVSTVRGVTRVFVADLPAPGSTGPSCFAAAACTPDGDALVLSRQAPPALIISDRGYRRAPVVPGTDELVDVDDDEMILIFSSTVFEEMPQRLARVLHGHPEELLRSDPGAFLLDVFEETGSGAGAVITRGATHPDGGPA
ncbi:hypothetical protein [Intrasporangium calvum]|uniref:hypothetical protein n=1 Tax=Intrasporangium calvum TaxID=53358 RepID=UPI0011D21806|nr:hypothetical protein [Intrasporangium calvum]